MVIDDDPDLRDADQSSTTSSSKLITNCIDESSLETQPLESIFDKVEMTTHVTLEIEDSGNEWSNKKLTPKHYSVEHLTNEKIVLVDFTELPFSEMTKLLLNDIYSLAGVLGAEELYIGVSLLNEEKNKILRSLLVFGYEKVIEETFTSNTDVVMLRIDVNQEYDFVDLI